MDYNGRASQQFRSGNQTSTNGGRGRQQQQKAPDDSDLLMRLVSVMTKFCFFMAMN